MHNTIYNKSKSQFLRKHEWYVLLDTQKSFNNMFEHYLCFYLCLKLNLCSFICWERSFDTKTKREMFLKPTARFLTES